MVKKLFLIALFVVIIDRITKFLFPTVLNKGAAFSILQGKLSLFIIVSLIVIALIIYYRNFKEQVALGLLLGGTIGNLIDRVIYKGVLDFINLYFWRVNIADISNLIAGILLIKYFWKK